jgi:hypothetical protein
MSDEVKSFLQSLTANQRRYLSKRECAWCEMPLNRPSCGAIGEECPPNKRIYKAKLCLQGYKPRIQIDKENRKKEDTK